jgi:predicted ATPase/DNA-binding CsgD family transcriptional regulator/GAF domain-containing protein
MLSHEQQGGGTSEMADQLEMTLSEYMNNNKVDVTSFLRISIGLAELVGRLHQAGEIKRSLIPDHIVGNPESGQFKLIELPAPLSDQLKSKYAFMSPEQTGRMNRKIDGRSHLYVLGIIYYEMLMGYLPFEADTASEWVYAHMAVHPKPMLQSNSAFPQMICDIVMKLLSKPVEKRYQSTYGLCQDLKCCMDNWRLNGRVEPFAQGQADALIRFEIPQTLYGRGKETEELVSAFERVRSGRMELMLITGTAGCGKTMLVKEFQMTVQKEKGYFIAGKFDQLKRDIPYAPFIQAFQNLVRQILAESPEQIVKCQKQLLQALGQSGAVITEVIPEVALIIGKQYPVENLPPADATNRFQQLFLNFIRVFAIKQHPLVLFLDDLQWADLASLRFLRVLLDGMRNRNLLLVGAYRDNELSEGQPLQKIVDEEIRNKESSVVCIKVEPLNLSEVHLFVAETLHNDLGNSKPLAEVLFRKTAGNPFYLTQMLQTIYNDKLIYFNEQAIRWEWDLKCIMEREGFNGVIPLIIERFDKLPEQTRFVLSMAACIGNTFSLSLLSLVCEQSSQQTERDLSLAIHEGLVLTETDFSDQQRNYIFLHDRVQQAIYDLLPEDEIKQLHLKIGRMMLKQGLLEASDDFLLETVYQLNLGSGFIVDPSEGRQLAEINLRAGRKAKASTAYDAAIVLLHAGIELIYEDDWSIEDSLYFNLLLESSECEYYCGNFAQAEEILEQLMQQAQSLMDRTKIYLIQITMYSYQNNNDKAMKVAIRAMAEFGLIIPFKPTRVSVLGQLLRTWWQLRSRLNHWTELPKIQDPHHQALANIVIAAATSVTIVNPEVSVILFSKYVRQALKEGDSEVFSFTLSAYALILCLSFGRYKMGLRLVENALQSVEKLNSVFVKGRVYHIIGMVLLFNRPKEAHTYFKQAIAYNLESGDLIFTGYGVTLHVVNFIGDLRELHHLCAHYVETTSRILDPVTTRMLHKTNQFVLALQARALEPLTDDPLEDEPFPGNNLWITNHYYYCYTREMEVRYVRGYYAETIKLAKRSEKWERNNNDLYKRKQSFYTFLAIAAQYPNIPLTERRKYLNILKKKLRQMKKWSNTAVESAMHKYLLMSAEMARLDGKDQQAVKLYNQAMVSARESGFLQYEAIACERAGRYYHSKENEKAAEVCIQNACRGYLKWGAIGKVNSLCEAYPAWLTEFSKTDYTWVNLDSQPAYLPEVSAQLESNLAFEGVSAAANTIGGELDLSTILQAAKIVSDSGEDEHQHFQDQFLNLALSNTGAERGFIIMEKDGELIVDAEKDVNLDRRPMSYSTAEEGYFSVAVVQFVLRTHEPVVLGEAIWSMFASDPYMNRMRPRSILCMPVLYPDNRKGVVYLENNLTADAFTADRLEVLDIVFSRMVYLKSFQKREEANEASNEKSETIQVKSHPPLVESLTKREMEILRLMADGQSNKEIGRKLEVTEGTVKNHALNIYGKLQVKRRVHAITKARELHLLD